MSRASRQRHQAKRARERRRRAAKSAQRAERGAPEREAVLVSTFADSAEMEVAPGPLEADGHPECGRYGLRVTVVAGKLLMQSDGIFPGCMPIVDAEEDALRSLHAEAASAGEMPSRVVYRCRRTHHGITSRGRRLLRAAPGDSPLVDRQLELDEREVIDVKLAGNGPLRRLAAGARACARPSESRIPAATIARVLDPAAVRTGRVRGRYFRENFAQGGLDIFMSRRMSA